MFFLVGCSALWDGSGKDPSGETIEAGTGTTDQTEDSDPAETGLTETDTDPTTTAPAEDRDGDGVPLGEDCDDEDASSHPGAEELCDGKDNDCDGALDGEGDSDGDGIYNCDDWCPIYAAPGSTGDGRVEWPLGTVQEAVELSASLGCYEARAYQGTYYENVDFGGEPVNLESVGGVTNTIIDGQDLGSVVSFVSGESAEARIYGFTLRNGGGSSGAGINIDESDPTIEGNLITENVAGEESWLGGGIRSYEGSPTILDNEIVANDAGWGGPEEGCDGGGINVRGGAPLIEGNLILGNTAGDGGGIWIAYADATIQHNWISGNMAEDEATESDPDKGGQGGGVDVQIGGATGLLFRNNIVTDNVASTIGGGLVVYEHSDDYPNVTIANNVFAFNEVLDTDLDRGAGLAQWSSTAPVVYNNVVMGNVGSGVWAEAAIAALSYNDVWSNSTDYGGAAEDGGTGNLSVDCAFTGVSDDGDPENDDWGFGTGSPCHDAGDPAVFDIDGSRSDLGVFGGPGGSW